jgi:hypothetical protein
MFKTFTVKNFRCFGSLHLEKLERVNLIAGKNNTGKTALLEAIQLHNNPSDCQLGLNLNKARGIQEPAASFEDVLGWLFHNRRATEGLEISSDDEHGISRALGVWLVDPVTLRERFPQAETTIEPSLRPHFLGGGGPRIILRYNQTNEREQFSIGMPSTGAVTGLTFTSARIPWSIRSIFLTSTAGTAEKDVDFFAALEVDKRLDEIVPALQILEPRLQKVSLVPLAGQLVLHGDIGLSRLLPIPFMGEGLRRLLSIVLAITNAPGGVVLIDEVENGLHHAVVRPVWTAIAHAARRADAQVFATTHSYECISAAHQAFDADGTYDFALHRLDRLDGATKVVTYDREIMGYALEMYHEVR